MTAIMAVMVHFHSLLTPCIFAKHMMSLCLFLCLCTDAIWKLPGSRTDRHYCDAEQLNLKNNEKIILVSLSQQYFFSIMSFEIQWNQLSWVWWSWFEKRLAIKDQMILTLDLKANWLFLESSIKGLNMWLSGRNFHLERKKFSLV